jgi:pimeloyl-ACP methyl ester carboxylesterase
MSRENVTVVLAHGAWADGSSWSKVIGPLVAEGIRVLAAPQPLTSFTEDTAAVERTLERASGPAVLVGHAYAGAVIAAARSEKVKALVYVAALAPDEGGTVADFFYRTKPHPLAPKLAPDSHGLIYLPDEALAAAFAQNASAEELAVFSRGSAATFARLHIGACESSTVERPRILVSHRGAGPHDRPRNAAFYGGADARTGAITSGGSYINRYCTWSCC